MVMPNPASTGLLGAAITEVSQALATFAADARFLDQLVLAFGEDIPRDVADELQQQFLTETYELPEIKIVSTTELAGAQGVYAAATRTIYLSDDFWVDPTSNLERVVAVLLEEIGHDLDTRLNHTDAPGDEGEIFSALVRGKPLDAQQLQALQAEDDQTTLVIGGRSLQVEQADPKPIVSVKIYPPSGVLQEKNDVGRFDFWLNGTASADLKIYYLISGSASSNSDYKPLGDSSTLTISKGTIGVGEFLESISDDRFDPDETVIVTLRPSPDGSYEIDDRKASATITIKDDDVLPVARIEKVSDTKEPSAGDQPKAGQFKVTLSSPALQGTKVFFTVGGSAQEGTDFKQLTGIDQTGSVEFLVGQQEALIDITPTKWDYQYEPNGESVTLTLKEPAVDSNNPNFGGKSYTIAGSASTSASLTIADNNVIPEVRIERSQGKPTESKFFSSAVYGSFYVKLTAPALNGGLTIPYTVSGTATPGLDHNLLQSGV